MTRYAIFFILSLSFFGSYSCKKQKSQPAPATYPDYMAMRPGNYWIYEDYELDSVNGAAHALGTFDSSYVEKDTDFNGHTYHKIVEGYRDPSNPLSVVAYLAEFIRDSLSYSVNNMGYIYFSSEDFSYADTLYENFPGDTIKIIARMAFKDSVITVDAGTFKTSTHRAVDYFYKPNYNVIREYDHKYAQGIGLILETTDTSPDELQIYEKRLVRYHVQ